MIVGAIGLIYGFIAAPETVEDVKEMMASEHHGEEDAAKEASEINVEQLPGEGISPENATEASQAGETHTEAGAEAGHGEEASHEAEHYEHVLHQLQNKPWAALYVAAFFFFMISLGVLAFYAVQYAAQAGWSPVLFRVMEAITAYLLPGGIIVFVLLVLSGLHLNHLFIWMDPEIVAHDEIIQNKTAYLNVPFFLIRAAIYLGGWILFRH